MVKRKPDYPQFVEKADKKIEVLQSRIERLTELIQDSRRILQKHLATLENKSSHFDRYYELLPSDPEAAAELKEEKKLDVTKERADNKEDMICADELRIDEARKAIACLRRLKADLLRYNPIQRQVRSKVVQEQYYFAGTKHWAIPNSVWKTFQDIFSPPKYRMRPKREGAYGGRRYDDLNLQHCVVDPQRIPNQFLTEFGFPVPDKGMNTLQRLMFKEGQIGNMADFFTNHLEPLEKPARGRRVRNNYRLLVVNNFGSEHDGKIVYPRYVTTEEETVRRKVPQVFDNAYATLRKTEHVDRQYKGETRFIINTEEDLKRLQQNLLALRGQKGDEAEAEKDGIKSELREKLSEFARSVTYHKRMAKADLVKVADLRDKLDRENLGASLARILKILRHLKTRRDEVFTTSLAAPEDAKTLDEQIDRAEKVIQLYSSSFELIHQDGDSKHLMHLRGLESLKLRPFNLYAARLLESADSISRMDGEVAPKQAEALKAYAVTRLFDINRRLEYTLCDAHALPVDPGLEISLEYLRDLYRTVQAVEVDDFGFVFDKIKIALGNLADQLRQKNEDDADDEAGLYKMFQSGLKEIDFQELADELG